MESGAGVSAEKEGQQGASYTYWVRKITDDAAPLPVPRKLAPEDVSPSQSQSQYATLGSAWNRVSMAFIFVPSLLMIIFGPFVFSFIHESKWCKINTGRDMGGEKSEQLGNSKN